MKKGNSFKELFVVFRNQDVLRSDGFEPVGWLNGKLVWKKGAEESSATKILNDNDIDPERILQVDTVNAVYLG